MPDDALDSEIIEEISSALANGQKIQAIKIYREATGQGLLEAKEFIDELIPGLLEKDPERFAGLERSQGCGATVLLLAISSLCIAALLA